MTAATTTKTTETLVTRTRRCAAVHPDRVAWSFHPDGGEASDVRTFAELDRGMRRLGALIQRRGLAGQRIMLLFPPGLDFGVSLMACMYAGAVAVPAYPPEPHRLEHTLRRLTTIIADARAQVVLCSPEIRAFARQLIARTGDAALDRLVWLTPGDAADVDPDAWVDPQPAGDDLAFLQYTSGSTSDPKGVMITHASLMANLQMAKRAYRIDQSTRYACWLPLYHDMGLVGHLMLSLEVGARVAFMPPAAFLKDPASWLQLATDIEANLIASPNFGFDYAAARTAPARKATLDLSTIRVAVNGAGPVSADTIRRFGRAFADVDFRPEAMCPSYGMAELALFATCSPFTQRPVHRNVDKAAFEEHRVVFGGDETTRLTSSGRLLGDQEIVIVDPQRRAPVGPGRVGEIWIAGAHVAAGYWRRPEKTAAAFGARLIDGRGPYLRTGDLGFIDDGELFVTGRIKDVLVIRGRNHYPQDFEATLDAVRAHRPEVRLGCGVAVSLPVAGEERLAILQEVDPRRLAGDPRQTIDALRQAIARAHALQAVSVVLLAPGSLPKTSSGKRMRQACRTALMTDLAAAGLVVVARHDLDRERVARRSIGPVHRPRTAGPLSIAPQAAASGDARADLKAFIVDWLAVELGEEIVDQAERGPVSFSALGMDSTLAVELLAELEEHLDRSVSAQLLTENDDLDALVAALLPAAVAAA